MATPTHPATACDVTHERQDDRVFAIIVTFHPDPVALRRLVDSLLLQVDGLVVADNGSDGVTGMCLAQLRPGFARYIDMGWNLGVAEALNHGIKEAFASGASHVLLFDQDSLPEDEMAPKLLSAYHLLESQGRRVATVGPQYVDPRSGYVAPFHSTKWLWLSRVDPMPTSLPVEVDFVITSGSLISRESWTAVGPMAGPMFIDYVDIEWGLRARGKGFASYGIRTARLSHSLGDHRMKFLGRSVPIHSPLRHYYQIRNPLFLYRQTWIPLNWKLVDGCRLVLRFLFNSLFVAPRGENIMFMAKGVMDGLIGRLGKME